MTEMKSYGRPRKKAAKKPIYESDLYVLLVEKLPIRFRFKDGRIDTDKLAKETGFSRWTIYRWFQGENMRPKSAKALVHLSHTSECERKGALSLDMLTKFVTGF